MIVIIYSRYSKVVVIITEFPVFPYDEINSDDNAGYDDYDEGLKRILIKVLIGKWQSLIEKPFHLKTIKTNY